MRLNSINSRAWMISHWSLFVLTSALLIASICLHVFLCGPHVRETFDYRLWSTWDNLPKCVDYNKMNKNLNGCHILTDAALLAVPVVMLWSSRMKLKTKFRVWIVGIIGCVNIVLSICRIISNDDIPKSELFCES